MTRTLLAATAAALLMAGAASAQTTTETTTTQTMSPVIVPAPVSQAYSQRTVDNNGVVTEHSKTVTSDTTVSPLGDMTTTRRTTDTTTVR